MTRDFHVSRRSVTRSALLGSAALLLGGGGGAARAATSPPPVRGDAVLTLPAPTGPHPVGRRSVHLVDTSRPDPLSPGCPVRELMLTLYYPARDVTGLARAPQLPARAAAAFGQIAPFGPLHLPAAGVDWSATASHSYEDAPALPGRRPVLVHSPGGGDPRGWGTCLAEDLAAHGAVVVSVDHPGDAAAVEFPDVTPYRPEPVRETVLRGEPRDEPALWRTLIDVRIADLHFVLGRLRDPAGLPLPDGLAGALDARRVGVYGHSAGGSAVTEVLFEDRRIRAGINLEGYLDHPPTEPGGPAVPFPVVAHGLDRPLLLLGSDGFDHRRELARSWQPLAARSPGRVRSARVAGAGHWTFTDFAAVLPQLRAAGLTTADRCRALIGTAGPEVSVPYVRRTVRAFFARHLSTRQGAP
ncbi:alpha/beta hydrolase [Streptomyces antimicrobicus]|uniref:Alpha/beta hydrolase n=1 Tax=Streptomyces antimicrobicus TaxID=2883108 RepID=A0ABS8B528_9ACTN|nr:alpha/beta hydrolase [Streptomyces antimicrobicus]MCB5179697.1 alpha/beta hydrolase [Streptomyces antimicrobicus]